MPVRTGLPKGLAARCFRTAGGQCLWRAADLGCNRFKGNTVNVRNSGGATRMMVIILDTPAFKSGLTLL